MVEAADVAIYLLNGLYYTSLLFLLSIGMNMIYGILKVLNMAHASFMVLGMYVAASLVGLIGAPFVLIPFIVLLVLTPIVVGISSISLEVTVFRPLYNLDETFQLLGTFGLLIVLDDVMKMIWGAQPVSTQVPVQILGELNIVGRTYPLYNIFVILVFVFTAILLHHFFFKTKIGKIARAMAQHKEMAIALGINVNKIYLQIFILAAALAALGGAVMVPMSSAVPGIAVELVILAFAVIVVGGLGSFEGTIAASLVIGIIRSFGIAFFPEIELAVVFLIMAVVMLIKPSGLFGETRGRVA